MTESKSKGISKSKLQVTLKNLGRKKMTIKEEDAVFIFEVVTQGKRYLRLQSVNIENQKSSCFF